MNKGKAIQATHKYMRANGFSEDTEDRVRDGGWYTIVGASGGPGHWPDVQVDVHLYPHNSPPGIVYLELEW